MKLKWEAILVLAMPNKHASAIRCYADNKFVIDIQLLQLDILRLRAYATPASQTFLISHPEASNAQQICSIVYWLLHIVILLWFQAIYLVRVSLLFN